MHDQQARKVKPATFDVIKPWLDYKTQFEICALQNKWIKDEALQLAMSLRGQDQSVLSYINENEKQNYGVLTQKLKETFAPPIQTKLYRAQLTERTQRLGESLPELEQDI